MTRRELVSEKEEENMKTCVGCKYFEACGDVQRTEPCKGKEHTMRNEEIARQCFASLVAREERFLSSYVTRYYVLIDGNYEDRFYADSDEDAKEIFFSKYCRKEVLNVTSSTYIFELRQNVQDEIREKLTEVIKEFYGNADAKIIEETVQNGMDGKLCDIEECIDIPLFLTSGKVNRRKEA